jgi:hypothetical protein
MAIVRTGNPNSHMRAQVMQNNNITQQDMLNMQQSSADFMQMNNISSGFMEEMNMTNMTYANDEVFLMGEQLVANCGGVISRDKFQPITYGETNIDSFVTMTYIASHPVISSRINKGLMDGFSNEIGTIHIDSLEDNGDYLRLYEGDYDNPYADYVIESYEEYNSKNIENEKLSDKDVDDIKEMYELLDEMCLDGIDITRGVLPERD